MYPYRRPDTAIMVRIHAPRKISRPTKFLCTINSVQPTINTHRDYQKQLEYTLFSIYEFLAYSSPFLANHRKMLKKYRGDRAP